MRASDTSLTSPISRQNDVICRAVAQRVCAWIFQHRQLSDCDRRGNLALLRHQITASPDGLDVILASRCVGKFLP